MTNPERELLLLVAKIVSRLIPETQWGPQGPVVKLEHAIAAIERQEKEAEG